MIDSTLKEWVMALILRSFTLDMHDSLHLFSPAGIEKAE
jgi:hypothetical protein